MNKKEELSKFHPELQSSPTFIQKHIDKISNLHQKCWNYYPALIKKYPFDKAAQADLK